MGQTKFKAQIPIILWLTVVFGFSSVNAEGYSCYNDYCNSDPNFPQYCYDNQQRCKACDDAKRLCGGPEMVLNCTQFCLDDNKINKRLELKMKEQKEKPCAGAAIPAIVNGTSDGNNFGTFKQNTTVNYSCDGGFSLNGSAITCGPFGQWSPAPRCQATVCVLPKMSGLTIQPVAAQYSVSTRVSVTCNGNKRSVVLTCNPSGTWDLPIPSCDNGGHNYITYIIVVFSAVVMLVIVFKFQWKWCKNKSRSCKQHGTQLNKVSVSEMESLTSCQECKEDVPEHQNLSTETPSSIVCDQSTNVKIGVANFFGNGNENMKAQQERTETRIDEDVGNTHQPMETYKQPCPETTREQCSKEPVFPSASKQRGPVLTL